MESPLICRDHRLISILTLKILLREFGAEEKGERMREREREEKGDRERVKKSAKFRGKRLSSNNGLQHRGMFLLLLAYRTGISVSGK